MAVVCELSNHFKHQKGLGAINMEEDVFKIILMNDSFAFDPDAHGTLADVTASPSGELATGYGYTRQAQVLSGGTWANDSVNDQSARTFDTSTWSATGGSIGPTGAAIIYDETTADDTIVGCIDFGTDYTVPDNQAIQIITPKIILE